MYNGVGLQTARGSGTSGYVQKNLAYVQAQRDHKFDYAEQLKKMKENPLPPPKPPNKEILDHEERRRRANEKFMLKRRSQNKDLSSNDRRAKIDAGEVSRHSHKAKIEKEKAMNRLADAFKIDKNTFEHGAAFDLEVQEK